MALPQAPPPPPPPSLAWLSAPPAPPAIPSMKLLALFQSPGVGHAALDAVNTVWPISNRYFDGDGLANLQCCRCQKKIADRRNFGRQNRLHADQHNQTRGRNVLHVTTQE